MQRVVLVGFSPDNNGCHCNLHPFGCGNSLILNRDDRGVGICLRLHMIVQHELTCYTINSDSSVGCRVCFITREYAASDNGRRLDGAVVKITEVFMPDHGNRSIQCLYHHNHGYAYAVVESLNKSRN